MAGVPNPSLPFGLRDVRLTPMNADSSLGTPVDLPASRTFSFSDSSDVVNLEGDDVIVAAHDQVPTVDWDLEAGGISLAAYLVMAGGTIVTTGTTPATKSTYTKLVTNARPYFKVEGQAISDSGGDMHAVVYRCKVTGSLDGEFGNGAFFLTKCKGTGFGDTQGASPTGKLYDFILNETAVAIP